MSTSKQGNATSTSSTTKSYAQYSEKSSSSSSKKVKSFLFYWDAILCVFML